MPFEPPSLLTQTANAKNLYLLASEGNVPDPLIVNDLVVTNESTITTLNVDNVNVSSGIITLSDTAGNQTLQATGADLFFNGQLLAKAGDIQDITAWADYPAIAEIDVDTKGINNAGTISFGDTVNTLAVNGENNLTFNGTVIYSGAPVSDWANSPAVATVDVNDKGVNRASSISFGNAINTLAVDGANNLTYNGDVISGGGSVADWANSPAVAVVDVNNKGVNQASSISFGNAINTLTTDVGNNLTYNGTVISGGSSSPTNWSSFPALTNVDMNNKNINSNGTSLGIQNDRGADILGGSQINLVAKNGLGGSINLTADTGYLGTSFGAVNIVANGGTTAGVGTGGLIQLTANTPFPDLGATSAIKFSASGINSYAGAIPSIGSVAGFNFIYGQGGVNICSGLPSALLSHPLVTYIYGTNGIELNSDVYTTKIFPYWDGGTFDIPDLEISGRNAFPGLNSGANVKLSHVTNLDMITGAITGVSTINGAAYPPTSSPVTSIVNGTASVVCNVDNTINITSTGLTSTIGGPIVVDGGTTLTTTTIGDIGFTSTSGTLSLTASENAVIEAGAIELNSGAGLNVSTVGDINMSVGDGLIDISCPATMSLSTSGGDITIKKGTPGSGGTQIILASESPPVPPAVGLYVNTSGLFFNGSAVGGGGGVTTLNSLSGAVTITAGTNISLTTVGNNITVNQINIPVTNRASLGAPILITATTSGTAQTIVNLSLTTTAIYDIDVFAVSTITTSSNTRYDLTMFITIDGVQVGNAFTSSIDGIGHFLSFPAQCAQLGATAAAHTILLKAYANVASVITVNNSQLTAIGNLA